MNVLRPVAVLLVIGQVGCGGSGDHGNARGNRACPGTGCVLLEAHGKGLRTLAPVKVTARAVVVSWKYSCRYHTPIVSFAVAVQEYTGDPLSAGKHLRDDSPVGGETHRLHAHGVRRIPLLKRTRQIWVVVAGETVLTRKPLPCTWKVEVRTAA